MFFVVLFFGIVLMFFIFPTQLHAQVQKYVTVDVNFKITDGNLKDAYVVITRANGTSQTMPATSHFKVDLDFGNTYILSFNKPGYITKKMEINTNVDAERQSQGFDGFEFTVVLFKQYDNVNIVVFNQPVGRYAFSRMYDDFNFDTDYTKTIQSAVQEAENELKKKEKEEKSLTKKPAPDSSLAVNTKPKPTEPPPVTQEKKSENQTIETPLKQAQQNDITPQAGQDNKTILNPQQGNDNNTGLNAKGGEDGKTNINASGGNDDKSQPGNQSGNDGKITINTAEGNDKQKSLVNNIAGNDKENSTVLAQQGIDKKNGMAGSGTGHDEAVVIKVTPTEQKDIQQQSITVNEEIKIDREEINEDKRTILNIWVTRGNKTILYTRISYAWGGVFYFKDNKTSISENLFRLSTNPK